MELHSQIVWSFEGKIIDHEKFFKLVEKIKASSYSEVGSIVNWWSINRDKDYFHLLEILADAEGAMTHLDTLAKVNDDLCEAVEISQFTLHSDVPQYLDDAIAKFKPTYMRYYGGWSKL
ncbi:MAG: hypothetical protein R3Y08_00915 [Rikenellaceae bacterium]